MKTSEQPKLQYFHIAGVKHILPGNAFEAIQNGNAVMIDVREIYEVQLENIQLDKVLNHPMSVIMDRLPYISKDQKIIVICAHGERSVKVANLLQYQGYPEVASLDGGFEAWKKAGLPYESVLPVNGCGCHSVENKKQDWLINNPVNNPVTNNKIDFKNIRRI
jgi:rhodanese-related sulfurtransferase